MTTTTVNLLGVDLPARTLAETKIAGVTVGVYDLGPDVNASHRYCQVAKHWNQYGTQQLSGREDVRQAFTRMGEEVRFLLERERLATDIEQEGWHVIEGEGSLARYDTEQEAEDAISRGEYPSTCYVVHWQPTEEVQ